MPFYAELSLSISQGEYLNQAYLWRDTMSILHSNDKLHAVYFTENEEHEPRKKTKSKLIFTILFFIKSIMKKLGFLTLFLDKLMNFVIYYYFLQE